MKATEWFLHPCWKELLKFIWCNIVLLDTQSWEKLCWSLHFGLHSEKLESKCDWAFCLCSRWAESEQPSAECRKECRRPSKDKIVCKGGILYTVPVIRSFLILYSLEMVDPARNCLHQHVNIRSSAMQTSEISQTWGNKWPLLFPENGI